MKGKNTDRDKFISKMRSRYERVFSKTNHRTRYKGVAKDQFAVLNVAVVAVLVTRIADSSSFAYNPFPYAIVWVMLQRCYNVIAVIFIKL